MQAISIANPSDAYKKQGVLTASPGDLVVMLYDGLKKNMVLGGRAITRNDTAGAHKYLMKSQNIVSELMNSLDMSYDISEELLNIYEFILWSLKEANLKKDASTLEPVIEITETLRSAWKEVASTKKVTVPRLFEEEEA